MSIHGTRLGYWQNICEGSFYLNHGYNADYNWKFIHIDTNKYFWQSKNRNIFMCASSDGKMKATN